MRTKTKAAVEWEHGPEELYFGMNIFFEVGTAHGSLVRAPAHPR